MTSVVAQIRKKEEQKGPETTKETETKKNRFEAVLKWVQFALTRKRIP